MLSHLHTTCPPLPPVAIPPVIFLPPSNPPVTQRSCPSSFAPKTGYDHLTSPLPTSEELYEDGEGVPTAHRDAGQEVPVGERPLSQLDAPSWLLPLTTNKDFYSNCTACHTEGERLPAKAALASDGECNIVWQECPAAGLLGRSATAQQHDEELMCTTGQNSAITGRYAPLCPPLAAADLLANFWDMQHPTLALCGSCAADPSRQQGTVIRVSLRGGCLRFCS